MKRKNRNKGFTLVELLVTVVILALVVAPFLAAFVYASGNNLNASIKQDAANLAEDVAEEIKGKSLEALKAKYGTANCKPIYDASGKDTGGYKITIADSNLPTGVGNKFVAEAKLEPATNSINEAMPTLTNINDENTMLLMQGFYINDVSGAIRRDSTITLQVDQSNPKEKTPKDQYHVKLDVKYTTSSGNTGDETVSEEWYDEMPSIFAVYTPLSSSDTLKFDNKLEKYWLAEENGENVPVKLFLSIQKDLTIPVISNSNILIHDEELMSEFETKNIEDYIRYCMSDEDHTTNVYTDAGVVDASGNISSLIENVKSVKLYDLTVEVKYKTGKDLSGKDKYKQCAKYVSSKLNLG